MDRRQFLQRSGAGLVTLGAAAACGNRHDEEEGCERCSTIMARRECGEDTVGLLGYGCMRWQTRKDENGREFIDQDSVNELVDLALESGVNYFDSAPVYIQGGSERATAIALLRHPREEYFIATKCSNFRDHSYEGGVKLYRESLENFETDHIDYYLLHSIANGKALKERFEDNGLMDFFLRERELGHIRHLGFSCHGNVDGLDEILSRHAQYHWDFVQIQMNWVDWTHAGTHAKDLYEKLTALNIPVVVMEPLLGGRLANVPDVIAGRMKEREPSRSVASWAFRFCGSFPNVLTVLSGMTYREHLEDNISTFTGMKALSEEEMQFLEEMAFLIKSFPLVNCTACQYCMPCPYGIDIPGIFRHYNAAVNSGGICESPEQKSYGRLRRRYLHTYDKSIESFRQADHCIECRQCVEKCPQHIRIPDQLRRIDKYVESLKKED